MDDAGFAGKVLGMFAAEAPLILQSIEDAIAADDMARAAGALHRFRGMAANVSMAALAEVAMELELICTSATRGQAIRMLETLKTETDRCLLYIPIVLVSP
jgi:HPt (histidine-containing phosphotransfer) domain-containing protein